MRSMKVKDKASSALLFGALETVTIIKTLAEILYKLKLYSVYSMEDALPINTITYWCH